MWARKISDTFGDAELVVTDDTTEDEVRAWLHDQYGALDGDDAYLIDTAIAAALSTPLPGDTLELLASAMGLLIRPVED